jgi:hypothetical protein
MAATVQGFTPGVTTARRRFNEKTFDAKPTRLRDADFREPGRQVIADALRGAVAPRRRRIVKRQRKAATLATVASFERRRELAIAHDNE